THTHTHTHTDKHLLQGLLISGQQEGGGGFSPIRSISVGREAGRSHRTQHSSPAPGLFLSDTSSLPAPVCPLVPAHQLLEGEVQEHRSATALPRID
ncbi:unnamed protein product, partial [Staurois parvus]